MSFETQKLEIIQRLIRLDDELILAQINEILGKGEMIVSEEIEPYTRKELQNKIEQSEKDIEEGNTYSSDEIKRYFERKAGN
jgi:dihydrofolate reductase